MIRYLPQVRRKVEDCELVDEARPLPLLERPPIGDGNAVEHGFILWWLRAPCSATDEQSELVTTSEGEDGSCGVFATVV